MDQLIPFISCEQMREVDRLMVEYYNITLVQMMENAGRNLARLCRKLYLAGDTKESKVLIMAGTGGNGGGGIVCARHLANWGVNVEIWLSREPEKYTGVPAHQLAIVEKMGIEITVFDGNKTEKNHDVIVDAIIGYSLAGNPRGKPAEMIEWINQRNSKVLSLDNPSGIDPDGKIYAPAVKANATMTLALPKIGFKKEEIKKYLGKLYLADISVPPELFRKLDPDFASYPRLDFFSSSEIIHLF